LFDPPAVESSETVLQRYYGDVLPDPLHGLHQTGVGISPSEFSPSFARQRIPRLNILDKLAAKFWRRTKSYEEKADGDLYTTREIRLKTKLRRYSATVIESQASLFLLGARRRH